MEKVGPLMRVHPMGLRRHWGLSAVPEGLTAGQLCARVQRVRARLHHHKSRTFTLELPASPKVVMTGAQLIVELGAEDPQEACMADPSLPVPPDHEHVIHLWEGLNQIEAQMPLVPWIWWAIGAGGIGLVAALVVFKRKGR